MSLSSELLAQARFLVDREPKQPKQASLRRAISSAYYSLFHLLIEDGARAMFAGNDAAELRAATSRAFQHTVMKSAARGFAANNLAEPWKSVLATASPELQRVAAAFIDLQQARHQADYDVGHPINRTEAADLVDRVEAATAAWKVIRKAPPPSTRYSIEARVFLAALLLHAPLSRR